MIKFKDILPVLCGEFDIYDCETDIFGPTYVATTITREGKKQYAKILDSSVVAIKVGIIILDCDTALLMEFLRDAAGQTLSSKEWEKRFKYI